MASSIEQIAGLMNELGLAFQLADGQNVVMTGFSTETYRNPSGEKNVRVMIATRDEGEMVYVSTHYCFMAAEPARHLAVQLACSAANRNLCLGRFLFDPQDGEVSLVFGHALLDGQLTARQLGRLLSGVPTALDAFDELLRAAVEAGELIDPADPEQVEFPEFGAARRGRRGVITGKRSRITIQ